MSRTIPACLLASLLGLVAVEAEPVDPRTREEKLADALADVRECAKATRPVLYVGFEVQTIDCGFFDLVLVNEIIIPREEPMFTREELALMRQIAIDEYHASA